MWFLKITFWQYHSSNIVPNCNRLGWICAYNPCVCDEGQNNEAVFNNFHVLLVSDWASIKLCDSGDGRGDSGLGFRVGMGWGLYISSNSCHHFQYLTCIFCHQELLPSLQFPLCCYCHGPQVSYLGIHHLYPLLPQEHLSCRTNLSPGCPGKIIRVTRGLTKITLSRKPLRLERSSQHAPGVWDPLHDRPCPDDSSDVLLVSSFTLPILQAA